MIGEKLAQVALSYGADDLDVPSSKNGSPTLLELHPPRGSPGMRWLG